MTQGLMGVGLVNQAVQSPQQLPKIFSSDLDAKAALEILLNDAANFQGSRIPLLAERVNVLQQFCEPQSLAWQCCEDKLKELALAYQNNTSFGTMAATSEQFR